jgi:hypothetical protein
MAAAKLFSYSIEDSDGRLVITVDGIYAKAVIDYMRAEVEAGRGWHALSQFSPVGPIHRLARRAFWTHQEPDPRDDDAARPDATAKELDLDVIFKQGFAETYDDFTQQLDRFGAALTQLKGEFETSQTTDKRRRVVPATGGTPSTRTRRQGGRRSRTAGK